MKETQTTTPTKTSKSSTFKHPFSLTASMIFARSQHLEVLEKSIWKCHWCGCPCNNRYTHDDPPPIPFTRSRSTAKCPGESYCCMGCVAWRRPRTTIDFLASGQKDGQCPKHYSWYITEKNSYGLRNRLDYDALWEKLLNPPKRFVMALKGFNDGVDTLLQLAVVNDNDGILASTPLKFTVNNIIHDYSVYELEESIRNGPSAYGPGVRALWDVLGEPNAELKKKYPAQRDEEKGRGRGRPPTLKDAKYTTNKIIVSSGN